MQRIVRDTSAALEKQVKIVVSGEETEIDTRELPEGVYLLQLQAGEQMVNRKVLVRH